MKTVYDFDSIHDRRNTACCKWDGMKEKYPDNPQALPFWIADMDFECPRPIVEAIRKRAEHPIYGYSMFGDEFGRLVSSWEERRNGWKGIEPHWAVYSNGIVPALNGAVRAYTEVGEGVIIQPPVYYPFRNAITNNGRKVAENNLIYRDGHWTINFDELEALTARPENRLLLLCNPHNPLSRAFTGAELERVGEICLRHNVVLMSDEIHSDILYPGSSHTPVASISDAIGDICITAIAPSKTFNIAGLQASAIIIKNDALRDKFKEQMSRQACEPNVFAITAFKAAYGDGECEEYLEQLKAYLWDNYLFLDDYLKQHMPKIKCQRPEATYLLWLDCRGLGMTQREMEDFILKEGGMACDIGTWFGGDSEGYMRLNIGCPRAMLREGLDGLHKAYLKRNL